MHALRLIALALVLGVASRAEAQVVVYRPMVPMFAPAAGPYVANYMPAGNYAAVSAYVPNTAVTAFSPVVETVAPAVVAEPVVAAMPVSPVAVTSYYAPTYAAPAVTTSYYAPVAAPVAPVVAAPVTTYYAPAAVAMPLYRRGPLGVWRPVRAAYYPYY